MNKKEKAKELVDKMYKHFVAIPYKHMKTHQAKQCALIAVDEILAVDCHDMSEENFNAHIDYWQGVKEEIIQL
jgi:hypothetical protein